MIKKVLLLLAIGLVFMPRLLMAAPLMPVRKNGKYGYINTSGRVVIPFQFDLGGRFSGGYASVIIGRKHGYINRAGKFIINPRFDYAWEFQGGVAKILKGNRFGYVNTRGCSW